MRVSVAVAVSVLSILGLAHADGINAAVKVQTNIPAQPLGSALVALARDRDFQLLYRTEVVGDLRTSGAAGELTINEALTALLAGTGLSFAPLDDRTIKVYAAAAVGPVSSRSTSLREGESTQGGSPASNRIAEANLEEITVTGTHIRGVANDTTPTIVLDRAYIDSTGMSTVTGLIESLPQNFALNSQSGILVPGTNGGLAQGAAISLRGIGEGTTLVLINGRRVALGLAGSAVDISALPLTAIERVEVLPDGASALYGSDAVGGVVNFVLRKDFEGAETRLRAGSASHVEEYRVSQALGSAWSSGNALVSLEYYKRDLLRASDRDFVPSGIQAQSLYPEDKNLGVLLSGRQSITAGTQVFLDALYTQRDSVNLNSLNPNWRAVDVDNPQFSTSAGLTAQLPAQWQMEVSGTYGENHERRLLVSAGNRNTDSLYDSPFEVYVGQIKADGPLMELPGGRVRAALGADWRKETIRYGSSDGLGRPMGVADEKEQSVRSAFAELSIPVVGAENSRAGLRRLEVSLAGRYDDYSNFGSSTNPKIGLMWEPASAVKLRTSWGTSYRAPKLSDYSNALNAAVSYYVNDPAKSGTSHLLYVFGTANDSLLAEQSESYTFGADFTPGFISGFKASVNLFHIRYTDRIDAPATDPNQMLANPQAFGSLIDRDVTLDDVNAFVAIGAPGQGFFPYTSTFTPDTNFDPGSIDVLVDLRRRNLSRVKAAGLDVALRYDLAAAGADWHFTLDATHLRELSKQVTVLSAKVDNVDTYYNPPDWRGRLGGAWSRQSWTANLFVNYTDSYLDNRSLVGAKMDAYTTVDVRLAYDFSPRFHGVLNGVSFAASVHNLFDEDPPAARILDQLRDLGFDPTNSNPIGRLAALELVKRW